MSTTTPNRPMTNKALRLIDGILESLREECVQGLQCTGQHAIDAACIIGRDIERKRAALLAALDGAWIEAEAVGFASGESSGINRERYPDRTGG